ncbi:MAG: hypothetical protein EXR07_05495 [Acetobacteraceae bacterium]|nr:hypothetical protein [Acetobacteraceae bacterium]
MPEFATAEIIQFPARVATPGPPAHPGEAMGEPDQSDIRLDRALADLNDALIAQQAVLAAWKSALSDLLTGTRRLGASLHGYNDSLGHLDTSVHALRREALKLEAWAGDTLTKKL